MTVHDNWRTRSVGITTSWIYIARGLCGGCASAWVMAASVQVPPVSTPIR